MKKPLTIVMAVGLIMYPFAAFTEDYGSPTTQPQQQAPPVAQTLVREGDFAIRLAAELNLGQPKDEASAEDLLTDAGVLPDNGWISDYPVTPEIIGQLQVAITKSASEDKVPLSAEQATKGLYSLASKLNLPVPAGPGSPPAGGGYADVHVSKPVPEVVYDYYYDAGPPVITYYAPPYDYLYLYDWVPYPVWWTGFWFPGFYICHNFTTTVIVTNGFIPRRAVVSNHFIDRVSGRVAIVTPVTRTGIGRVQPVTMLRTENGGMFRTVHDLRNGTAVPNTRTARGEAIRNSRTEGGFATPAARSSASTIFSRSYSRTFPQNREVMNSRSTWPGTKRSGGETRSLTPGTKSDKGGSGSVERSKSTPHRPENTYTRPMTQGRSTTGYESKPSSFAGRWQQASSSGASGFSRNRIDRTLTPTTDRSGSRSSSAITRGEEWSPSGSLGRSSMTSGRGRTGGSHSGSRGWRSGR